MNKQTEKKGRFIHYKKNWLPLKGKPDTAKLKKDTKSKYQDSACESIVLDQAMAPLAKSIRDAWKGIIVSRTKAVVFLTIGFKVHCSNEEAINAVNFLLKVINNDLFNHDFGRDLKVGLTGICICEPHMLSFDFRDQLHFHILLDENSALKNVDSFRNVVYKAIRRVVTKSGYHMMDENVVDVQEIRDINDLTKLSDYLTKTMRMHTWKRMENLCFVEPRGLVGVGVSYQRNVRNH